MSDPMMEHDLHRTANEPATVFRNIPAWQGSDRLDSILLRLDALRKERNQGSYVLGVTSCERGAGVSVVAGNLAVRAAQLGLGNVLLIDCNLEHPVQSQWFQLKNPAGLVNLIAGETDASEVVTNGKVSGLSVLSAGNIRSITLIPEAVESLMKSFRADFDLIVLDMTPVKNTARSLVFAGLADGVVLVVDGRKTKARHAKSVIRLLQENGVDVVGTILNRAKRGLPRWLERLF